MNKLFYCNNSGQLHYVYAKNHSSAAHKFKQRFKKLFGCWNFNAHDIREVKKTFPQVSPMASLGGMDPQIVEERKTEISKQITENSYGIK